MAKRDVRRISTNSGARRAIEAVPVRLSDDDLPERSRVAIKEARSLLKRSKVIVENSRRLIGDKG